jgi:hypothetical protein
MGVRSTHDFVSVHFSADIFFHTESRMVRDTTLDELNFFKNRTSWEGKSSNTVLTI